MIGKLNRLQYLIPGNEKPDRSWVPRSFLPADSRLAHCRNLMFPSSLLCPRHQEYRPRGYQHHLNKQMNEHGSFQRMATQPLIVSDLVRNTGLVFRTKHFDFRVICKRQVSKTQPAPIQAGDRSRKRKGGGWFMATEIRGVSRQSLTGRFCQIILRT